MRISQLFILAPNGHTIVHRDYRGEVPKEASETFLRRILEKAKGDDSPIFSIDGVNYLCVRKNGIFFLCTTVHNVPPALVIELLTQLTKVPPPAPGRHAPVPAPTRRHVRRQVCKDYIGVLNEESLRKNFTLVYELVDEVLDDAFVPITATNSGGVA